MSKELINIMIYVSKLVIVIHCSKLNKQKSLENKEKLKT
jgi:hypothetical protein